MTDHDFTSKKSQRVAVITRTKNRPVLLERALASVAGQTFRDFCWVVVNDGGSIEAVNAIVERAAAMGIAVKVVHNPQSLGMEAASNVGIRECESEFLVIHDDDDTWEPDFLAVTVQYLDDNPDDAGVVTHTTKVTEVLQNDKVRVKSRVPYNPELAGIYLIDLAVANRYSTNSFLFRRTIYDEVGGFDETLPVLGDWDFNLRVAAHANIGLIPRRLANYHHRKIIRRKDRAYGNTVIDDVDLHLKYDAILRNKWLRQDLATGRWGLGMLASLGRIVAMHGRPTLFLRLASRLRRALRFQI